MNTSLRKAAVFSLFPFGMAVVSDILFTGLFGGNRVGDAQWGTVGIHGLFWVAVPCLSALGALLGFLPFRNRPPSHKAVFVAAQLFAIASFFAVFFTFLLGGLWASGAWLLFGACLFAVGSAALGRQNGG